MQVVVEGRGTHTLSLAQGSLRVELDGKIILSTIGNPTKADNPAFETIENAHAYFMTLPISQPVEPISEEDANNG